MSVRQRRGSAGPWAMAHARFYLLAQEEALVRKLSCLCRGGCCSCTAPRHHGSICWSLGCGWHLPSRGRPCRAEERRPGPGPPWPGRPMVPLLVRAWLGPGSASPGSLQSWEGQRPCYVCLPVPRCAFHVWSVGIYLRSSCTLPAGLRSRAGAGMDRYDPGWLQPVV